MLGWILDHVPFLAWVALAIAGLFVAWRFLGLRGMLAALVAVIGGLAYRQGRKAGNKSALKKQRKADEKAVKDYDKIKDETGSLTDDRLDDANDPWVRKRKR